MFTRVRAATVLAAVAAVAAIFALGALPSAGQTAASKMPARIDSKPNLTGFWQALTEANWDLQAHEARPGPTQFGALFSEPGSVGVVEGNEIPYQPAALAKRQENVPVLIKCVPFSEELIHGHLRKKTG